MLEDFLALSRILTGVDQLNAELGRQYLDRLSGSPIQPIVQKVLTSFHELKKDKDLSAQIQKQIVANAEFSPALCQIVLLWFTSTLWDNPVFPFIPGTSVNLRYGTQEEYFSGLAWQIMGAHVPGLSGGYFGHWRYRPENEPREGQP